MKNLLNWQQLKAKAKFYNFSIKYKGSPKYEGIPGCWKREGLNQTLIQQGNP